MNMFQWMEALYLLGQVSWTRPYGIGLVVQIYLAGTSVFESLQVQVKYHEQDFMKLA